MKDLKVVQGDTLEYTLKIESPEWEINRVLFNCPSLQLAAELVPSNDGEWLLTLSSETTVDLRVGRWGCDITAYALGKQYTVIHNGNFIVEYKRDRGSTPTPVPPGVITGIGYTED